MPEGWQWHDQLTLHKDWKWLGHIIWHTSKDWKWLVGHIIWHMEQSHGDSIFPNQSHPWWPWNGSIHYGWTCPGSTTTVAQWTGGSCCYALLLDDDKLISNIDNYLSDKPLDHTLPAGNLNPCTMMIACQIQACSSSWLLRVLLDSSGTASMINARALLPRRCTPKLSAVWWLLEAFRANAWLRWILLSSQSLITVRWLIHIPLWFLMIFVNMMLSLAAISFTRPEWCSTLSWKK